MTVNCVKSSQVAFSFRRKHTAAWRGGEYTKLSFISSSSQCENMAGNGWRQFFTALQEEATLFFLLLLLCDHWVSNESPYRGKPNRANINTEVMDDISSSFVLQLVAVQILLWCFFPLMSKISCCGTSQMSYFPHSSVTCQSSQPPFLCAKETVPTSIIQ